MTATSVAARRSRPGVNPRLLRSLLPAFSLAVLLLAIFALQPRTMSYLGLNLLLNLAVPLALATIAELLIITVNDLDLSIGAFVGLTATITATLVNEQPIIGFGALALCVVGYGAMGALIEIRRLPSIVVTLGMSFVWLGLAIIVLPTPGGKAPDWLTTLMKPKPDTVPFPVSALIEAIPFPIIALAIIALVAHVGLMWSPYGAVLRGIGGNARAVERAGWSLLRGRVAIYSLAGVAGVLAGMALVGLTTSADANIAGRYTLLAIAGVILGGGQFVGGRVSAVGAVIGAVTMTLAGSFLSFLKLNPDWQIGAQGAILIIVLALRVLLERLEARR
jgi:ribose transport system permease protein